ncbi:Nucleic acid-binding protein [Gossypium australe]|uniref:DNA-directed RNA polymerase subunit n=1 Tax=Gossypium australe TaxID=47621 RepID=A0A5B6W5F4_9ROSI|nr:Nucleic acid-binding protein [Gossypium australe]
MEGLSVADANLVIYLHPSKSRNVSQSILRELGSLLFKFNETFDGVLLAYDVNILDKQAKILSGVHPYFGLRLKANLLLFSPKPDMLLEGKVVKLSEESIHVIVLGFLFAIITAENIRGEFKYRTVTLFSTLFLIFLFSLCVGYKDKEELFASKSHKRHVIKVGTMIRFLVKSFDEEILHIIGSLISAHTESIRWLDRHLEEDSEFDRSSMKSRDREWLGDKTVDEGSTPMSYDNHIKMSKKRRIT